jgi:hypothetical protein
MNRVKTALAVALVFLSLAGCRQQVHYADCAEARAAGVAPISSGQPGYRTELDRDGNGVACEASP